MLIVGVGASAGGQEAYTQLLKHLPLDTGMGFVLVQHLDPEHESALAQILSCATSLPVREITHNLPVQANHVYIIPRDRNLTIEQGVLKLEARERARTPHRPIDTFFKSLARDQRERAIGGGRDHLPPGRLGQARFDAAQCRGDGLCGPRSFPSRHCTRACAHCTASPSRRETARPSDPPGR